jgi:pyrimidine-nucleoside phosphorylase
MKELKAVISSQSPNLTPADGKIYALRDVTATVDNPSLICASVVSKKIASGANFIVLDVKYGSGAFVKTQKEAFELAKMMIEIGKRLGRKICAVISSMEQPLGKNIGNSLEIIECIEFLKGNYSEDLYEITQKIAQLVLLEAKISKNELEAKKLIREKIQSGEALLKFKEILKAQGGNVKIIDDYSLLPSASSKLEVKAKKSGYISKLDALKIAHAAKLLGAGRDKKEDNIDYGAGVVLGFKKADSIKCGDVLATLYYNNAEDKIDKVNEAKNCVQEAFSISSQPCAPEKLIAKTLTSS